MPCFGGSDSAVGSSFPENTRELEALDALLCSACRALEERKFDFDLNPALSVWWAKHKAADEAREDAENARAFRKKLAKQLMEKPLSNLSAEDKQLLREFGFL